MLEKGADVDRVDTYGQTPLSIAKERGRPAIVALLLAAEEVKMNETAAASVAEELSTEQLKKIVAKDRERRGNLKEESLAAATGKLSKREVEAAASAVTRTVNGTGHTGPSEFCATSI